MENKGVILVVPPASCAGVALTSLAGAEHIGLGYLAAAIRAAGISVEIINTEIELYTSIQSGQITSIQIDKIIEETVNKIIVKEPVFVGLSVTGPSLDNALLLAGKLRKTQLKTHICFGGHQATAVGREILEEEMVVDSIGMGECDQNIVQAIKSILVSGVPKGVPGFLYRENGKVVGQPPCKLEGNLPYTLDSLEFPVRDDLIKIQKITGLREARLSTSRGCIEHCTFCADAKQHNFRRYTMRSPENVISEIMDLKKNNSINHFWFIDDNFAMSDGLSQERAKQLAEMTLQKGLFYTARAYFRPDAVQDRSLLSKLFDSGIITALIGVESGSERRLRYLGKRYKLADVKNAVENIRSIGMGLQIGFIFFDPLTSIQDMRIDSKWLAELGEMYVLFNFVQNMDVYPGTAYRRHLENRKLSTAKHPWRGGFRQYIYEDMRIAGLANLLEKSYSQQLMSIDHAIWRVKLFHVPKLRWHIRRGTKNPRVIERTPELEDVVNKACKELNKMHSEYLESLIEWTQSSVLETNFEDGFTKLLGKRSGEIEKLIAVGKETTKLLSEEEDVFKSENRKDW